MPEASSFEAGNTLNKHGAVNDAVNIHGNLHAEDFVVLAEEVTDDAIVQECLVRRTAVMTTFKASPSRRLEFHPLAKCWTHCIFYMLARVVKKETISRKLSRI